MRYTTIILALTTSVAHRDHLFFSHFLLAWGPVLYCGIPSFLSSFVVAVLMFISIPSHQMNLTPVEYDKPYPGKLTVEVVTRAQLLATCSSALASSLGCAFPGKDRCHIKLLDEESMRAVGWTVEAMIRHERAHCNGWPQDHPGKRPYP